MKNSIKKIIFLLAVFSGTTYAGKRKFKYPKSKDDGATPSYFDNAYQNRGFLIKELKTFKKKMDDEALFIDKMSQCCTPLWILKKEDLNLNQEASQTLLSLLKEDPLLIRFTAKNVLKKTSWDFCCFLRFLTIIWYESYQYAEERKQWTSFSKDIGDILFSNMHLLSRPTQIAISCLMISSADRYKEETYLCDDPLREISKSFLKSQDSSVVKPLVLKKPLPVFDVPIHQFFEKIGLGEKGKEEYKLYTDEKNHDRYKKTPNDPFWKDMQQGYKEAFSNKDALEEMHLKSIITSLGLTMETIVGKRGADDIIKWMDPNFFKEENPMNLNAQCQSYGMYYLYQVLDGKPDDLTQLLDRYNGDLKKEGQNREELFLTIVLFTHKFNQYHFLSDGNKRATMVLMNRELVRHGFPFCMPNDQSRYCFFSRQQIVEAVIQGMDTFREWIQDASYIKERAEENVNQRLTSVDIFKKEVFISNQTKQYLERIQMDKIHKKQPAKEAPF